MLKQLLSPLAILFALNVGRAEDPAKAIPDYQPVPGWPKLPPKLELGAVSAVATDSKDRVFVAHRAAKPILVFDRDGKFLRSWGDDHI